MGRERQHHVSWSFFKALTFPSSALSFCSLFSGSSSSSKLTLSFSKASHSSFLSYISFLSLSGSASYFNFLLVNVAVVIIFYLINATKSFAASWFLDFMRLFHCKGKGGSQKFDGGIKSKHGGSLKYCWKIPVKEFIW